MVRTLPDADPPTSQLDFSGVTEHSFTLSYSQNEPGSAYYMTVIPGDQYAYQQRLVPGQSLLETYTGSSRRRLLADSRLLADRSLLADTSLLLAEDGQTWATQSSSNTNAQLVSAVPELALATISELGHSRQLADSLPEVGIGAVAWAPCEMCQRAAICDSSPEAVIEARATLSNGTEVVQSGCLSVDAAGVVQELTFDFVSASRRRLAADATKVRILIECVCMCR